MAPARISNKPVTGEDARLQARTNEWDSPTSGIAPGYLQANLIILPSKHAKDFEILCARNPVPCPLLASSKAPGDFNNFKSHVPGVSNEKIAKGIDIRTDTPRYNVYTNGKLTETAVPSIESHWDKSDHVAFLMGCSFSFENALMDAGLPPAHMVHGRNTPMYRTNIPLAPAGVFKNSTYVVSMRFYRRSEVEKVRDITRPYVTTHGEPVAWGWDGMRKIGVRCVQKVDWGDSPVTVDGHEVDEMEEEKKADGLVPVFWGCGVTPQLVVTNARIQGVVIGHSPGYMVCLDVREEDVLGEVW